MKKINCLFLIIVMGIGAHAQGVTTNGEITTDVNSYVFKNGRIGSGFGLTRNGKQILPAGSVVSTTGRIWMDRNLGASQVATNLNDAAAYGDLYQWGRGTDGHEKRAAGNTPTKSSLDQPGHSSFIKITTCEDGRCLAPGGNGDWRVEINDNLWQGVNGINNPCPSGFRLPTYTEFDAERSVFAGNYTNSSGAFDSPLKLTHGGVRWFDGSLKYASETGDYWTSTVDGVKAARMHFRPTTTNMGYFHRVYGMSVRCILD